MEGVKQGRTTGETVVRVLLCLAIAVGLPVVCGVIGGLIERGYRIGSGR